MVIKQWGFYLANIPFWDKGSQSFKHKARPVVVYNFSGGDVIALPVTSNENKKCSKKRNANKYEVEVKLEKFSLIKVNKPLTLEKGSLFKFFGINANTKVRRQIKGTFKDTVVILEKQNK